MDSNITNFPTQAVRDWVLVERSIKDIMQQADASQEMIKEVCRRMKEVWEKYKIEFKFSLELPSLPNFPAGLRKEIVESVQKAFKPFSEQIHEYTSQVLFDRLLLEIELYKLRTAE